MANYSRQTYLESWRSADPERYGTPADPRRQVLADWMRAQQTPAKPYLNGTFWSKTELADAIEDGTIPDGQLDVIDRWRAGGTRSRSDVETHECVVVSVDGSDDHDLETAQRARYTKWIGDLAEMRPGVYVVHTDGRRAYWRDIAADPEEYTTDELRRVIDSALDYIGAPKLGTSA